jgi:ABC-type transport system involved in multi-copper enzyme maturation permease subunit
MSTKPSPTFFGIAAATASLEWTRLRRSHRATLSTIAAALVTTVVIFFMFDGDTAPKTAFTGSYNMAYLRFLDLLLSFLCCAQVVAEEVESRTFGYVLVRPAPRGAIVLGKLAAGYGLVLSVLTTCFIALAIASVFAVGSGGESMLPVLGRAYGAVALHTLTVCTVCLACGAVMPEAAGVLAILYLGFFEFALSFIPFAFRLFSPVHHAAVLSGVAGVAEGSVPVISLTAAGLVLAMITLSALVLAMFVVGKREYRYAST